MKILCNSTNHIPISTN